MRYIQGAWKLLLICATLSSTARTANSSAISPDGQTCRDVEPHCEKYGHDYICAPNVRNWAIQYCALYCGLCTATTTPVTTQRTTSSTTPSTTLRTTAAAASCEDLYLGSCVADFSGRCGESLVRQLCQKSCGLCDDTTSTSPTATLRTTVAGPHCEDIYLGSCVADFRGRCGEPLIRQLCQKYCGLCEDTTITSSTARTTQSTTSSTTLRTTRAPASCFDKYTGSCRDDFRGLCGEQFVATACQKSCGLCDASTTSTPTTTHSVKATTTGVIQNVFCASASSISCSIGLEILCGSDGQLYPNRCEMSKAKCSNPSLTVVPMSQCLTTPTRTLLTTVAAASCMDVYLGDCIVDFNGRCGETLVADLCQKSCGLCNASTTSTPTTTHSVKATTTGVIQNVFCASASSISCSIGLEILCGSDGQLYPNRCEMSKAKCSNPSLTVVPRSKCIS